MSLLLAAFLLMAADGCNAEVRIVNDPGGWIGDYVARYERLRARGEAIVIDGYCASACTIVLGIIPRDKICVTSRAEFLFHAAYNPAPHGRRQTNREATDRLYSLYPSEIQRWIDKRGGLTSRGTLLSGASLAAMYPRCPEEETQGAIAAHLPRVAR
ncbi:hypothetical protein [Bradyrhizobium sp. CB2312]|uniref:hypothetical protein n=1 Tax=Bradyrhizobium sp. CB2312 TaxID=3039155 RepID=UPI0024B17DE6|nr:hypothetical protein [Bradyrhizobium sp. CB2312]WFU73388.1 hypothetical protein QA642_04780 [Bradyrhizobium sp. CB2312]